MATIAVGALTVTLDAAETNPVWIHDLGLRLEPGVSVDLGARYTQLQILKSTELRLRLDEGLVTPTAAGAVPQLESTG